uniref:Flap endonuclease 1 n=1 Tax=Tetraselmis sp. GSL018 TaxID=582737 RepID=A0A061R970_9CHLO|mmetsp:Transcript_34690/g.82271  ORF Transcript_34690/g.82271 Transcript_34690/m.82271 type:complete len:387 (-) Transcript_34690:466-1626(-)
MGIQGLNKLLGDYAPNCVKPYKFEAYFGRKIAIDASMHIYQFMVSVGRVGDQLLTNESGEVTSHLQGLFYRTCRMLENGIIPVYVFDGKPPQLKFDELAKRLDRRTDATSELERAKEVGDTEAIEKYSKRTTKVTRENTNDCMKLLQLMGVPIVQAPSEAEAQCSQMCKDGLVYGISSEDMDSLTFGCPRLIRYFMTPASLKQDCMEYSYDEVLAGLGLTSAQFIDLCILCGCDYMSSIRGIGPVKALNMIKKEGSLEDVIAKLDKSKYPVPDPFPYEEARKLFSHPDVLTKDQLNDGKPFKRSPPDIEGVVDFLVKEKNFNEERVRKSMAKVDESFGKAQQGRLESFFGTATVKKSTLGAKRQEEKAKGKSQGVKKRMGGVGRKK